MGDSLVFIYTKNNKIKALSLKGAIDYSEELLLDGYIHTETIEASMFIENVHNNCNDAEILSEIKLLSNTK